MLCICLHFAPCSLHLFCLVLSLPPAGIIEQLLGSNSAPGLGSNHSYATKGNHAHGSGANGSRSHGQLPDDEGSQHAPMVVGVITLQVRASNLQ
jgi:hypothetical protein